MQGIFEYLAFFVDLDDDCIKIRLEIYSQSLFYSFNNSKVLLVVEIRLNINIYISISLVLKIISSTLSFYTFSFLLFENLLVNISYYCEI